MHVMSEVDALLQIGHGFDVQRRMRQSSMNPRKAEQGQDKVDQRHRQEVPVVGGSFLEPAGKAKVRLAKESRKLDDRGKKKSPIHSQSLLFAQTAVSLTRTNLTRYLSLFSYESFFKVWIGSCARRYCMYNVKDDRLDIDEGSYMEMPFWIALFSLSTVC